jgi:hypothetical protein
MILGQLVQLVRLGLFVLALAPAALQVQAEERFTPCSRFGRMAECVTVELASPDEDAQAKTLPKPRDGRASIYIIRPFTTEPKRTSQVVLDGRPVAELAPLTYAVLSVPPGDHYLKVTTGHDSEMLVNVKPGEIYLVNYVLTIFMHWESGELTLLDKNNAQGYLVESKKVAPLR